MEKVKIVIYIFVGSIFLALTGLASAATYYTGDTTISNNIVWKNQEIVLGGMVSITSSGNLTIDNTVVRFDGNYGFLVNSLDGGKLTIKNNSFISVTDNTTMWTFIDIDYQGQLNISDSTLERFSGSVNPGRHPNGGISLYRPAGSVTFNNITMRKMGNNILYNAISIYYANTPVSVINSRFENTYLEDPGDGYVTIYYISGDVGSRGLVKNNVFYYPGRAVQTVGSANIIITNNTFIEPLDAGISFFSDTSNSYLGYNTFNYLTASKKYTTYGCNIDCNNMTFENNIVNGMASYSQGGFHVNYGGNDIVVRNSIIKNVSQGFSSGSDGAGNNQKRFAVYNNTIIGSGLWPDEWGYGLDADDSIVYNNTIKDFYNSRGSCILQESPQWNPSYTPYNVTFVNNALDNCYYGININNARLLAFIDTNIANSAMYDIYMRGGNSNIKFINTKFSESKVGFVGSTDRFNNYYYADVLVTDSYGNPIDGATVTLYNEVDNANYPSINRKGATRTAFTTDTSGHTKLAVGTDSDTIVLMAYTKTNTLRTDMTWRICADYNSYSNCAYGIKLDSTWYRSNPNAYQNTVTIVLPTSATPTVATPTFSPPAGTYSSPQNVTISTATTGATIHYTLDGSTPTLSSPTYTGPISVTANIMIKAKAWKTGMNSSTNVSATYNIETNRSIVTGPVAYWKFDENGGTTASDSSGNGNTATLKNNPGWIKGIRGSALQFDGMDDYVSIPDSANLDIARNITIEAWIKPLKAGTAYIVKKASLNSADGYELALSLPAGKAFFRINQKTSLNTYRVLSTSDYPTDGSWIHLAGVYDGSQMKIYLNGVLENSKAGPSNISLNNDNLEIGGPDASTYFNGTIDEVKIYDRALSAGEIKAEYDAGLQTVATPTFSPAAGIYSSPQIVTISTATEGAKIHYTTDGATPTESSPTYTDPITISSTTTVKAGGWKSGMNSSAIVTAIYTINTPVLTTITVSPTVISVTKDSTQIFTAQPKDQNGNPMTATVTWTSSNTTVGTISPSGVFTASAAGTATIKAANGSISGTATATVTVPGGPVAYWKFDEGAGTSALDSSGNGNTAILQNNPAWTSGISGSAIKLDGINDYVSTSAQYTNPQVFTLSLWFKTQTKTGGKLIGFGSAQTGTSISYDRHIYMNDSGGVIFGAWTGVETKIQSPFTYNDGNWHYAAASISNNGMQLYMDGSLVAANSNTQAENSNGYWRIGYDNLIDWPQASSSFYFNGTIDEVKIYNRALNTAEVKAEYDAGATSGINYVNPLFISSATAPDTDTISASISNTTTIAFVADARPVYASSLSELTDDFDQIIPQSTTGKVDAVVMVGDMDYLNSGSINTASAYAASSANSIPAFYITGNHELENLNDLPFARSRFVSYAYSPKPGPAGSRNTTYSFDVGDLHVVILNEYWDGGSDSACGWYVPTGGLDAGDGCNKYYYDDGGYIPDALYTWLQNDLNSNTKPWTVVAGHEPMHPQGDNHVGNSLDEDTANRDRLENLLISKNVTAFVNGHTHQSALSEINSIFNADAGVMGAQAGRGYPNDDFATIIYATVNASGYFSISRVYENPTWSTPAGVTLIKAPAIASVSTPSFSPPAGTYSSPQNITISTATTGATIHYTTDGTTPTLSSLTYTTPISISSTATLKAEAWKTGMNASSIAIATYNISIPVLKTITVSPSTASVTQGSTQAFTAQPRDQNGNPMTAAVTWTSSNTSVGTISSSGVFTASAAGTATIRAANGSVSGTANATVTIPGSPVAYWKFDEGTGTAALDSSGNGNTGTLQNNPAWVSGKSGSGIKLDGINDYVSTSAQYTNPQILTLSLWFRTQTKTGGKLIGFGSAQTGTSISYDRHIYMNDSGGVIFGAWTGAETIVQSPFTYNDGNWHYAAASISNNGMQLYMDGSLVASNSNTQAENSSGYWKIGYDNLIDWPQAPSSSYFNGTIDEVKINNRALSAAEIKANYDAGAAQDTTPPASITNLKNNTYAQTYINWSWTDPVDADFSRVMIYLDGIFKINVTKGTQFYSAMNLTPDISYVVSTHTVDTAGNVNKTWVNSTARTAPYPDPVPGTIFFDDMESGSNNWVSSGLWHITTRRSNSSTHSWWYGQELTGNYDTGRKNSGYLTSSAISLAGAASPKLSFMSWYSTDDRTTYDKKMVQISTDGGSIWTTLEQISDIPSQWNIEQIDLSGYSGKSINIRFYFNTRDAYYNNFEGWYIDDVKVE